MYEYFSLSLTVQEKMFINFSKKATSLFQIRIYSQKYFSSPFGSNDKWFEIFCFFVCAPKKIFIRKYLRFMLAIFLIFFYWTWSHNIYYRSFLNHQFDTPQNTNLQILCPPATKYRSRDSTALLLKYKSSYKISTKYSSGYYTGRKIK